MHVQLNIHVGGCHRNKIYNTYFYYYLYVFMQSVFNHFWGEIIPESLTVTMETKPNFTFLRISFVFADLFT